MIMCEDVYPHDRDAWFCSDTSKKNELEFFHTQGLKS